VSARAVRLAQLRRTAQRVLLGEPVASRLARLQIRDAGHGYDTLGANVAAIEWTTLFAGALYRYYFRVKCHGPRPLPSVGAAILVANHGGLLPLDAAMLWMDVLEHTDPPRVLRAVADHFVPGLPWVGTWFARAGMTNGTTSNVRELLERGELVLIFPEGMDAIGKPATDRYRIRDWRIGHAELAIQLGVPVIPVAIIGPDEQWRELARIAGLHPFGAPYWPIPATPLPLPVRYHLYYGEPLRFGPSAAQPAPALVEHAAGETRAALEGLIARGLRERRGLFR
jgi:1-acyl-sn-glycerol-3-phosphate acyltransferase